MTKQEIRTAKAIAAKAEHGVIQARDMLALSNAGVLPNDPRLHTTTMLADAWRAAGLPDDTAEQLYG